MNTDCHDSNLPDLTEDDAMELADSDVAELRLRLEDGHDSDRVVADGRDLSPSWRCLDGGAKVWAEVSALDPNDSHQYFQAGVLTEAYDEALTSGMDELGLSWEDGCIVIPAPDHDRFVLTVEFGNAAMSNGHDLADALHRVARSVSEDCEDGYVRDANGNTVGTWEFS